MVIEQPHRGPLALPAVLHTLKPLARVLDRCQPRIAHLFVTAHLVVQPLRLIACINLYLAQALDPNSEKSPLGKQQS